MGLGSRYILSGYLKQKVRRMEQKRWPLASVFGGRSDSGRWTVGRRAGAPVIGYWLSVIAAETEDGGYWLSVNEGRRQCLAKPWRSRED